MNRIASLVCVLAAAPLMENLAVARPSGLVQKPDAFKHYIDRFNEDDEELYAQYIPNAKAWDFLKENIPLFECPDKDIERTYYFPWWTYRKHIKQTPDGFVITEFLPPVGWAGKYNTINCAAGHHFYEGRWLHDPKYLNDYATFWFRKGGAVRSYSFWAADALWARYLVNGDKKFVIDLLPDLIINGLVGVRPRPDEAIRVCPLLPPDTWDWFCLDNVLYCGRILTIVWNKTGEKYGRGKGLRVFADGRQLDSHDSLEPILTRLPTAGTSAGWEKYPDNPVLGGHLGTCFDVTMLREDGTYRMWFSWRPKKSVALVESPDGMHWGEPSIVLGPNEATNWEKDINRPAVIKRDGTYHMWYTGQARGHSWIGYATSADGRQWKRPSDKPVLSSEQTWEGVAVMCPHVLWDEKQQLYRMWYSAGEQYEPNAIGYASSPDGIRWTKHRSNPVFAANAANLWEQHKVTACQVVPAGDWHIMFYIGFRDENRAQIGIARSRDGITNWQRHPANPIIFPTEGAWDADACYKPFAIFESESNRWLLWYNGRKGGVEQIGLAVHPGYDLGFAPQ